MTNLSSEWLIRHQKVETEAESEPKLEPAKKPSVKPYVPPVPFPQRLIKQKIDKQFSNFLDMFKKLHSNIPFAYALEHNPKYLKFMKMILLKKRRLKEHETITLTEECNAILHNKLPP